MTLCGCMNLTGNYEHSSMTVLSESNLRYVAT